MIYTLAPYTTFDVELLSKNTYASTTDDPMVIFDVTSVKSNFLVLIFKSIKGEPNPKLYFDEGEGFSEENAFALRPAKLAVYHIPLTVFPKLRSIRFDPCETSTVFSIKCLTTSEPLIVGALYFLYNKLSEKGLAVGKENLIYKIIKTIRDAPYFFKWLRTSESFWAFASEATLPSFKKAMGNLAFSLFDKTYKTNNKNDILLSIIVPTYNTRPDYLDTLVDSFLLQDADFCELVISDDASPSTATLAKLRSIEGKYSNIKVIYNEKNSGISRTTNAGILASKGKWTSFMDHDDALAPYALHVIRAAIENNDKAIFLYTDEYVSDENLNLANIFCKPAFDSVLLSGMNYINHFSIYNRKLLDETGLLDPAFDGSQDYELLLRYTHDATKGSIVHIPFPAYIWRRAGDTFSVNYIEQATENARNALKIQYDKLGFKIDVKEAAGNRLHKIEFQSPTKKPFVSVVIPNKNSFKLMERLCDQLLNLTRYDDLEIIVIDNGSTHEDILKLYANLSQKHQNFRYFIDEQAFNFSKMCNDGFRKSESSLILFLNNDIEVLDPDWLSEMVQCLNYPETGIVGAKLLYPDRTIQHNGVIVGLGGLAGHWYVGNPETEPGPMGRFWVRQSMGAVTGACLLVTRDCFEAAGGFDEEVFPIAYNDVDFCINANREGFRIIWTPFATLVHHESQTRGLDYLPENLERFQRDKEALRARHTTQRHIDDSFSPLYGRWASFPRLHIPAELPKTRENKFG